MLYVFLYENKCSDFFDLIIWILDPVLIRWVKICACSTHVEVRNANDILVVTGYMRDKNKKFAKYFARQNDAVVWFWLSGWNYDKRNVFSWKKCIQHQIFSVILCSCIFHLSLFSETSKCKSSLIYTVLNHTFSNYLLGLSGLYNWSVRLEFIMAVNIKITRSSLCWDVRQW